MEGSKSKAVFDSLNLNPQLFINETINSVDDLVDEAFDFYGRDASALLKIDGSDRSKALANGIDRVHGMIQSVVDKRMQMWEQYGVQHCFSVPDGFGLPESDESVNNDQNIQDGSYDKELDAQLDSLRHKLKLVGQRSAELNSELQALESPSVFTENSARLVNEALEIYDKSSMDATTFIEMAKMASELRGRMDKLKTRRMKGLECTKVKRLKNPYKELSATTCDAKLEDLEKFLAELRKM